jgi:hypothetical protein
MALTDKRGFTVNSVGEALVVGTNGYLVAYAGDSTPSTYNMSGESGFQTALNGCVGALDVNAVSTATFNANSVNVQQVWAPIISETNVIVGVVAWTILEPSQKLTYESWRLDDTVLWQDAILPTFHKMNPDIFVTFDPLENVNYVIGIVERLNNGYAGDLVTW